MSGRLWGDDHHRIFDEHHHRVRKTKSDRLRRLRGFRDGIGPATTMEIEFNMLCNMLVVLTFD